MGRRPRRPPFFPVFFLVSGAFPSGRVCELGCDILGTGGEGSTKKVVSLIIDHLTGVSVDSPSSYKSCFLRSVFANVREMPSFIIVSYPSLGLSSSCRRISLIIRVKTLIY